MRSLSNTPFIDQSVQEELQARGTDVMLSMANILEKLMWLHKKLLLKRNVDYIEMCTQIRFMRSKQFYRII